MGLDELSLGRGRNRGAGGACHILAPFPGVIHQHGLMPVIELAQVQVDPLRLLQLARQLKYPCRTQRKQWWSHFIGMGSLSRTGLLRIASVKV